MHALIYILPGITDRSYYNIYKETALPYIITVSLLHIMRVALQLELFMVDVW